MKNMELAHYVDRLQDENDELRKKMGWLSGVGRTPRVLMQGKKKTDSY
jgi:hypothetical protein